MRRPPSIAPRTYKSRPKELEAELANVIQGKNPATEESEAPRVSTRLRERLEEKQTYRRRLRLRRISWIGAVVGVVVLAVWAVAFSPLTGLEAGNVEVAGGSEYISEGDVREIVADFENTPLIRVDTDAIRDALVEGGAVSDASFVRVWPRGLRVELRAREPVVASPKEKGFILLDGKGVEVTQVSQAPEGLPVVGLGKDNDDVAGSVAAALSAMDSLPKDILKKVKKVTAKSPDSVEFTLKEGATVVWGNSDDAELKAAVLEVLLKESAEVYNVTSPTSPITTS